jgi:hypothetical protein
MSHARRTLRIPDAVIAADGTDKDTLFYSGALQAENGLDVDVLPLDPAYNRDHLLDTPLPVRPSGDYPDEALRIKKLGT